MTNQDQHKLPEGKFPFPVRSGAAPFKALEKLLDVQRLPDKREAVREVKAQAVKKLAMLEDMYNDLINRATRIVEKAREDLDLHDIPINARKERNCIYYLYREKENQEDRFFSILSPEDYLTADPDSEYLGSYQLNEDSSWSRLDDIK